MGKRARDRNRSAAAPRAEGEVGPREPCPCGSGRRYKNCHGSASGAPPAFVARPFAGLSGEADLVALRELVPSATAPLTLADGIPGGTQGGEGGAGDGRRITLVTLLPMVAPAVVRESGDVLLALQVQHSYGDPSRDLAAVLEAALGAEPGSVVGLTEPPGEGRRLQDLLADAPLEVSVHDSFDFWVDGDDPTGMAEVALETANDAITPTARLVDEQGRGLDDTPAGGAAYWTDVGTKEHLRWVMPHDEDALLTALARLHVSGADVPLEGARLVGAFRAHGLLAPVWDLPLGTGAAALAGPAAQFSQRLGEALADDSAMTPEQRAARQGLAHRQLTIR